MRYENNERLREYLDRGAAGAYREHLRHPRFEFNDAAFAATLELVRAQFPDLAADDAEARAAFRLLTSGVAPEVAVPLPSRWFRCNTFVREKSVQSWPWLKLAWAIAVLLLCALSVLLLGALTARAEPTPQSISGRAASTARTRQVIRNALRGVNLLAGPAPQQPNGIILQFRQSGSVLATRPAGLVAFDCTTGMSCSFSGNTFTLTSTGGGGGITTLNTLTAATQLFAKTDDTNVTLGIGSLTATHTFTMGWTGTLAIARGGTGSGTSQGAINLLSQLTTNGDLLYHNGTNSTRIARGTDGQCLTSNTTTILWGSCAGGGSNHNMLSTTHLDSTPATVLRGGLISGQGATPTWSLLTLGAANRVLRSDGTDAAWSQVAAGTDITGILPIANGGLNTSAAPASVGQIPIWDGDSYEPADPFVSGITAHDAVATSTNPVLGGGYASAAAPADVSADGDAVRAWFLRNGSQVFNIASGGTLVTLGQKAMSASLPVVIASDQPAFPVTGTFFQATQPVSISQTTTNNDVDVVTLPNEGQQTMANSVSVAVASDQAAVPIGGDSTGAVGTRTGYVNCDNTAIYSAATNGNTELVALTASDIIYVCGFQLSTSSSSAVSVRFVYGTGTNCATGETSMTPTYPLQAAASTGPIGLVVMTPGFTGLKTIASNALCIETNAAASVQAIVWYAKF